MSKLEFAVDQYNDPCNQKLVKLASEIKLPEQVLEINLDSKEIEKLASSKFAWPEARLFPIHTPEDTLLSSLYFLEKSASLGSYAPKIEDRIQAAVISHNIEEPYLDILQQKSDTAMYKKASDLEEYALNDGAFGVLPITDPDSVLKSAEHLEENSLNLGYQLSKQASEAIMSKAEYFGVDLDKYARINAYCGQRGIDFEKAAEYMIYRAKRAPSNLLKESMARMTQAVMVLPELDIDFEKVAEFIDTYDKISGTDSLVRRGNIPDGYNTIFNSPLLTKLAGVTLAGNEYSEEDFKSLPVEKWAEALGEDFVKAAKDRQGNFNVDQAMNIAATLPLPDARVLGEYLQGNIEKRAFLGMAGMAAATAGGRPKPGMQVPRKTSMNPLSKNFRGLLGTGMTHKEFGDWSRKPLG